MAFWDNSKRLENNVDETVTIRDSRPYPCPPINTPRKFIVARQLLVEAARCLHAFAK
jgi:hypothetical protein